MFTVVCEDYTAIPSFIYYNHADRFHYSPRVRQLTAEQKSSLDDNARKMYAFMTLRHECHENQQRNNEPEVIYDVQKFINQQLQFESNRTHKQRAHVDFRPTHRRLKSNADSLKSSFVKKSSSAPSRPVNLEPKPFYGLRYASAKGSPASAYASSIIGSTNKPSNYPHRLVCNNSAYC